MQTLCVIGGSGFVGSALRRTLRARGCEVVVIGRSPTMRCAANEIYLSRADHDADSLAESLDAVGVTAIVDLAYASTPNPRRIDLLGDVSANLAGLIDNLDLACRLKIATYLFVSSGGTVYGDVGDTPLVENQAVEPITSYGIAKLACERAVHLYYRSRGLPAIVVRPSNIYGPGQLPFTGQGMVATALGSGALGRPVTVFGDGESVRDYLFGEDCGEGMIALIERGESGRTYNLGSGIGVTTNALLATVAQTLDGDGHALAIDYVDSNAAAIRYNVLDRTRIGIDTGWAPQVSLAEGTERTWAWLKANMPAVG